MPGCLGLVIGGKKNCATSPLSLLVRGLSDDPNLLALQCQIGREQPTAVQKRLIVGGSILAFTMPQSPLTCFSKKKAGVWPDSSRASSAAAAVTQSAEEDIPF